jgi:hypothetical protein
MEYNWNTLEVEVFNSLDGNTDVVYSVKYGILTSENGTGVTLIKEQELNISSITEFIPFEDLTDETVIGWVKSDLGESGVIDVQKEAEELLNKALNTSTKTLKYD